MFRKPETSSVNKPALHLVELWFLKGGSYIKANVLSTSLSAILEACLTLSLLKNLVLGFR